MPKINLSTVTTVDNLTSLNSNFTKIQDALNDAVLYRDNPVGEPNGLQTDLDVNGKDVLNVGSLDATNIMINGESPIEEMQTLLTAAEAASATAATQAGNAASSATSASNSASTANAAATSAANSAIDAENTATSITGLIDTRMPLAPTDVGKQYAANGDTWTEVIIPEDPVTFSSLLEDDTNCVGFTYPTKYKMRDPLAPSVSPFYGAYPSPLWGTPAAGVLTANKANLYGSSNALKYIVSNTTKVSMFMCMYMDGTPLNAYTNNGFVQAGHTLSIGVNTNKDTIAYLSVGDGTTTTIYADTVTGSLSGILGWTWVGVTFEYSGVSGGWISELFINGVSAGTKLTSTTYAYLGSSSVPSSSNWRVSGDVNMEVAAQAFFDTTKTLAEMQALFDQFKSDNSIT